MKITEYINSIVLPAKFGKYKLSIETLYIVYKLNSNKDVVQYKCLYDSELENFNPNFSYYIEPSTVYLIGNFTNSKGEVSKIILGSFGYIYNSMYMYLDFHQYRKYKHLIKAVKKALGITPRKGSTSYRMLVEKKFDTYTTTILNKPKSHLVYTYLYSNNKSSSYSKENLHLANDYAITNNLSVINMSSKKFYKFEEEKNVELLDTK
jgi:hypothetical protein